MTWEPAKLGNMDIDQREAVRANEAVPAHAALERGMAQDCPKRVPPRLLFCGAHWKLVPKKLQALVWRVYKDGQEIRKDPTREYLWVQRTCVALVAMREGKIDAASSIIVDLTVMLARGGAPDLRVAVQNWIDKLVGEITKKSAPVQLELIGGDREEAVQGEQEEAQALLREAAQGTTPPRDHAVALLRPREDPGAHGPDRAVAPPIAEWF